MVALLHSTFTLSSRRLKLRAVGTPAPDTTWKFVAPNPDLESEGAAFPDDTHVTTETDADDTLPSIPDTYIDTDNNNKNNNNNNNTAPIATVSGQYDHLTTKTRAKPRKKKLATIPENSDTLKSDQTYASISSSRNIGSILPENPDDYTDTMLSDHSYASVKSSGENPDTPSNTWESDHTYASINSTKFPNHTLGSSRAYLTLVGDEIEGNGVEERDVPAPGPGPSFGTYREAYDHFRTRTRPETKPKAKRFTTREVGSLKPIGKIPEGGEELETDVSCQYIGYVEHPETNPDLDITNHSSDVSIATVSGQYIGHVEHPGTNPDPDITNHSSDVSIATVSGQYIGYVEHPETNPDLDITNHSSDVSIATVSGQYIGYVEHPETNPDTSTNNTDTPIASDAGQYIGYVDHPSRTGSGGYLKPVNDRRVRRDQAQPGPSFGTYREAYDHFPTKTRPETKPKTGLNTKPKPKPKPKPKTPAQHIELTPIERPDENSDTFRSDHTYASIKSASSTTTGHASNGKKTDSLKSDVTYASIGSARDSNTLFSDHNGSPSPDSPSTSSPLRPTSTTADQAEDRDETGAEIDPYGSLPTANVYATISKPPQQGKDARASSHLEPIPSTSDQAEGRVQTEDRVVSGEDAQIDPYGSLPNANIYATISKPTQ